MNVLMAMTSIAIVIGAWWAALS